jgi:glycosyltransferase involved in cell wall biosynthesis
VNVILVDGNAPWVRALFEAMPADVTVHALRPVGPAAAFRRPGQLFRGWRKTGPRWWERTNLVPSWSKLPWLSSAACGRHVRQRLAGLADPVIVYTLPFYSRVAGGSGGVPKVYFAYDPYKCYTGWDRNAVAAGEVRLLQGCDAVFAISPALADDYRKLSNRPVFVQPNGVSASFLEAFDMPLPPPDELPPGGPPVVGCVGQISRAYDWDLLLEAARRCPEALFTFVGPVFPEGPEVQEQVDRVFAAPNVRWLGPRPHEQLPRYIQRFDVCLNPLRVDRCNDRRSLLRLYDYLASDRPIVSTTVASALDHRPHVEVGRDAVEIVALIRRLIVSPGVDRKVRHEYIRQHTWERRAQTFLTNLRSVLTARSA